MLSNRFEGLLQTKLHEDEETKVWVSMISHPSSLHVFLVHHEHIDELLFTLPPSDDYIDPRCSVTSPLA